MSDGRNEGIEGSCGGLAKGRFELGKNLLDRIKVWAVSRQIAHCRTGLLDRFSDASNFVTGEIVHHDDVALAQGRGEEMLDVGQEAHSIHRPIENTGRSDLIMAKCGNECRCQPMAMRRTSLEALSARRPPKEPHHIGLRPSFINEDKTFWVQIGLTCMPLFARSGDIRAILLGSTQ